MEEKMPEAIYNQKRQEWKDRIATWEKTDLSVPEWCRQNSVNRSSFYEWLRKSKKSTVKKKSKSQTKQKAFIEIPFDNLLEKIGIEIQCQGVNVRVEKAFDEETLSRVVSVLKGLS
jgi:predicted DNA-binding protein YlxM (UPF0122 family)